MVGEIERKAAPSAADIENTLTRLNEELGGDMALLGELRIGQALAWPLEIGAGVLPVGIEEEIIEAAVEIVVVRDVALGAPRIVALLERAERRAKSGAGFGDPMRLLQFEIR